MYVPKAFRVDDPATLHRFLEQHSFATLITPDGSGAPAITHLPLELDPEIGEHGALLGHVARANDHWKRFDAPAASPQSQSVAIFHGPHAYISPAWYEAQPAVPTWNYAVVHCHGTVRLIEEPARVAAALDRLIERNEAAREGRWSAQLPAEYRAKLTRAIVAFEFRIERFEGKFKLGQNRSLADREGVLLGLESSRVTDAETLAAFIRSLESDPGRSSS